MRGIKLYRYHFSYETTIARHLATIVGVSVAVFLLILATFHFAHVQNNFDVNAVSAGVIYHAALNTFFRLLAAYAFSVIVAIPVALFIVSAPRRQAVFLPVADVLQSVPAIAFFPAVIVFTAKSQSFEGAAIFILFAAMLWNIVFPVIGGLKTIPEDIQSAAVVFHVGGWKKFQYILLPSIFPFFVTGSLLAWAQGWTTVIVAEVLHTYTNGSMSQDLLGLGSLLVDSNAQGRQSVFTATLITLILLISLINLFVWQRLLQLAQRFKFD